MSGENKLNAVLRMPEPEFVYERDRRAMNHMTPEMKITHARLEEWGAWAKDHGLRPWPKTTPMGRMIEEGPHGAGQTTRPPIAMPTRIEEVDSAVAKLGEIDKKVIKQYYEHWQPEEVMAKECRMPLGKFKSALKRARWRVQLSLILESN